MIKNTIRAVAVAIAHPAVADAIHRSKFSYYVKNTCLKITPVLCTGVIFCLLRDI